MDGHLLKVATTGALILTSLALLSCNAPQTIGIKTLSLDMDYDTRLKKVCGKTITFNATVVQKPDSHTLYYAQDPGDPRAEVVVVVGGNSTLPSEGSKVHVSGRLICDPPFPTRGSTFYVQEMIRR